MPCFSPLQAFKLEGWHQYGLPPVFKRPAGAHREIKLPCGQCIGCRLERSRQWAVRCMHEASLYENNCFLTLTYDDAHLPNGNNLVYRDFVLFMKRLRKRCGSGIRFYMCGEYGEQFGRPHFHACVFNFDAPDKVLYRRNRDGDNLYNSNLLSDIWQYGYVVVGALTFESAAYVARYVLKKMTTPNGVHPKYIDFDADGNIFVKRPEFTNMSRKPGIGAPWLQKFQTDVYPSDFLIVNGKRVRPPRFYDARYEIVAPSDMAELKKRRVQAAARHSDNNTPARLRVREIVQSSQLQRLKRNHG